VTATSIEQIVAFIREADQLKRITRKNKPLGQERLENSAEHSWQVALMAISLAGLADPAVDLLRVVKMLLVHDLGEIDTGDIIVYAEGGWDERKQAELKAIERICALLPEPLGAEFIDLWRDFDAGESPEARFAHALDRSIPALLNLARDGQSWVENGISYEQVVARIGPPIRSGCPSLWDWMKPQLDAAQAQGWFGTRKG